MSQFIVYACPTGALADHLERFFEKSLALCGANAAHRYMPHCTLTGFFHEAESSVPLYGDALGDALGRAQPTRPNPPIQINALACRPEWIGLELESAWLKGLVADFACTLQSPTRQEALRLKSWLHLSLAYEFDAEQFEPLQHLAQTHVDVTADVSWELRYYQRIKGKEIEQEKDVIEPWEVYGGDRWLCHDTWQL